MPKGGTSVGLPKYLKTAAGAAGILAALCLGLLALPLLLPFVLGWLFSLGAEPGVRLLGRRTRLPRWLRSGICMTLLFLAAGTVLYWVARILWAELRTLALRLPELLRQLQPTLDQLRSWLEELAARTPRGLRETLLRLIDRLFQSGDLILQSAAGSLTGLVSRIVAGLPDLILTLATTVVAAYMISAALPEVKQRLGRRLPAPWQRRLREGRTRIRNAFGGWIRAQLKMMGIVFLLLTAGFWLLRVEYALLFGGIVSLLDALPVLVTGTVLIPWALISFLQENSRLGFGLLILYGVTALTRMILEPRLVGRHLGLPPLVTLMAFYVGGRLFGIPGMILFPLLAMLGGQLLDGARKTPAEG